MDDFNASLQYLISLPPQMADRFEALTGRARPQWFAGSDPAGRTAGSGGGTGHLLVGGWQQTAPERSFADWLKSSRKLVVHGGGQSRRLPAYAVEGKPLMPIPVFRWARGQRLDQVLLDLQLPAYERVLAHAPRSTVALIASGDVLLRFGHDLPAFPEVDVLGLGMWVTPETAKDFGVFFTSRNQPQQLRFFLQKPSPAEIRELGADHLYLVDTGMWLLSERALNVLLLRCGWDAQRQEFEGGLPTRYELYGQFGPALGDTPTLPDDLVSKLSCAVIPLPQPEFYHFGTSRQLIESVSALQNLELDERKLGLAGAKRHPDQYLQNSTFRFPLRLDAESHALGGEQLHSGQLETGARSCAHGRAGERLGSAPGTRAFAWISCRSEGGRLCLRFYGMDDPFRGAIGRTATRWLNAAATEWFAARGLDLGQLGLDRNSRSVRGAAVSGARPLDNWIRDSSSGFSPRNQANVLLSPAQWQAALRAGRRAGLPAA